MKSEDKIAVCEKTAGLRSGNSSDLDSACLKVLVPVKIFQIQDMLNENRFLNTFRGHNIWPQYGEWTVGSLSSVTCAPMFMQFTGCHQPVQGFYWPENAIDWLRQC